VPLAPVQRSLLIRNGDCDGCLATVYPTSANSDISVNVTRKGIALGTAKSSHVLKLVSASDCACDGFYRTGRLDNEIPLIIGSVIPADMQLRSFELAPTLGRRGILAVRSGFPIDCLSTGCVRK
jgi:hypothetical protein